jgi:hypothetical protein
MKKYVETEEELTSDEFFIMLNNCRDSTVWKFDLEAKMNGKNESYLSFRQKLFETIAQKEFLARKLNKDISACKNLEFV